MDVERVALHTTDGHELAGTLYAPAGAVRRAAVLHSGAGIPATNYTGFAQFLAGAGIAVLTYDYRGIALSRPERLRGFRATHEDWAEFDCAAAIAWLRKRYPQAELIGIAHSFASLLIGGAPNAGEQSRLILIGAHTGYWGDYRLPWRVPMALFWHGLMPAVTRMLGFFPGRALHLGQDLPRDIALQWAGRHSPDIRAAEAGAPAERRRGLLERCAALRCPALAVSFSDDAFASPLGTERLLSYYTGLAPLKRIEFSPADAGSRRIGHFGFFRRSIGAALWPRLLASFETALPR